MVKSRSLVEDAVNRGRVEVGLLALLWIGPILKADDQLAAFFGQRLFFRQNEPPLVAVGGSVVILLGVGLDKLEVDAPSGGEREGVVAQVLARFDVVLIVVGPVEFHLLALVGDGVNALLVATLGDEVAFAVVTAKEVVEVRVNVVLEGGDVHGLGEFRPELLDAREALGICAQLLGLLDGLGQLGLDRASVLGLVGLEGLADLGQKIVIEKAGDFLALGVHDAVDAEVQLGLVELEHLRK